MNESNNGDAEIFKKYEKDLSQEEFSNDPFWTENYKILFYNDKLSKFFPTINMTLIEKLNAVFRMSIYMSILLYLFTGNYLYFYIMIIVGAFTIFIFYKQRNNIELFFNSINNSNDNLIVQREIKEKSNEIVPTTENPFMNINLITDDKMKEAAPPSWNNDDLQKNIEEKFGYNLYRDVGDLYGKSNSQRQYYTAPSTTIPNNQTAFAKWCYNVGPTCKESSIYCAPEMNQVPYIDTTNIYPGTNVKY
jgi:hypothetical protein